MNRKYFLFLFLFGMFSCYTPKKVTKYLNEQFVNESETLTSEGDEIYYNLQGKGDTLVVFIHANKLDHVMFDKQVDYFASNYKTLSFDIPGYGKSTRNSSEGNIQSHLKALIQKAEAKVVNLVATDANASMALDFAAENSVASLTLISPLVLENPSIDSIWALEHTPISSMNQIEKVEHELRKLALGPTREKASLDTWTKSYVQNRLDNYFRSSEDIQTLNDRPWARHGKQNISETKMLILFGVHDFESVKMSAQFLKSNYPKAVSAEIKESSRLINLERPELFNTLLHSLISSR